jgi:hypothetical protein
MSVYIKAVCRHYSWASPLCVSQMYCDAKDIHGIIYWFNDLVDQLPKNNDKNR